MRLQAHVWVNAAFQAAKNPFMFRRSYSDKGYTGFAMQLVDLYTGS